tara:strand:- start:50 stop:229 length:180 start_codon:yes stop_codon:yes gene_type:complete
MFPCQANKPPSIGMYVPLINPASELARKQDKLGYFFRKPQRGIRLKQEIAERTSVLHAP